MKRIGERPLTPAERTRRWREAHPERAKAVQQAYTERHPGKRQEISRAYYERNAKSEKARTMAWRAANPEEARRHRRESYHRHRDKNIAAMREWQRANMDKVLEYQRIRRARVAGNGAYVVIEKDLRRLLSSPCAACGSFDRIEMDHIIPISRGGSHGVGNLQALCFSCNRSKGSRFTIEWKEDA